MRSDVVRNVLLGVIAIAVLVIAGVLLVDRATDDGPADDPAAVESSTDPLGALEPYPLEAIDVDAWHADLMEAGAEVTLDRMPRLYELVADSCDGSLTAMIAAESVRGSDPVMSRINFEYVCPSSLPQLEQAIELATPNG